MKVLMITGTLPPYKCGVGDYTEKLNIALCQCGHSVFALTSKGANKSDDYKVLPLIDNWDSLELLKIFKKVCVEIKPDIIHIQMPTANYNKGIGVNILIPYASYLGFRTVITLHEYSDSTRGYKFKLRNSLKKADSIIVVEPSYIEDIVNRCSKIKKEKISYINIGSSIPQSVDTTRCNRLKRELLGNKKEYKLMSTFGFISPVKRFDIIIEAMNDLKRTGNLKSILLIVGDLSLEDKYQYHIRQLIQQYSLEEYVIVTGYMNAKDVADYIKTSDFACLLFDKGFSVRNSSLIAVLTQDIPIITTKSKNVGYLPKTMFVDNTILSVKNAIIKMQNHIYETEAQNIECQFDWKHIADRHNDVYQSIHEVNK